MAAETTDKKKIIKEYLWITFAVVIMDIGIYVFKYSSPSDVATRSSR